MRNFKIDTNITDTFDLNSLNEDYIVIKNVSSDSLDKLNDQQFKIVTSYPDGRIFSQLMHTGAYLTPYTEDSLVELNFSIEDCRYTKITAIRNDIKAEYKFGFLNLKELLNDKSKKEENQFEKIKKRVANWFEEVTQLNNLIQKWTQELSEEITVIKSEITLNEERTGSYKSEQISLIILNDTKIIFEPKGTYILGAYGRIDIVSNSRFFGNFILVLQEVEGEKLWYLIENRDNSAKKIFNKSQLFKIIQDAVSKK